MKILLIHGGDCKDELSMLRAWLEAEGCDLLLIDLSASADQAQTLDFHDIDAVICVVSPALPQAGVQIIVSAANAKGKKIIGVQLQPSIYIESIEKYGSAYIPLNRDKVVDVVCGDTFEWENEEGEPREAPDTERHKCKKRNPNRTNAPA